MHRIVWNPVTFNLQEEDARHQPTLVIRKFIRLLDSAVLFLKRQHKVN